MTDAELAALDAVVVYYMSRGWPSYSDRERADKEWTDEKSVAQSAAFKRHLARTSSRSALTGAAPAGPGGCDVAQKESARPRPDHIEALRPLKTAE